MDDSPWSAMNSLLFNRQEHYFSPTRTVERLVVPVATSSSSIVQVPGGSFRARSMVCAPEPPPATGSCSHRRTLILSPDEKIGKLTVLVLPSRLNLMRYHKMPAPLAAAPCTNPTPSNKHACASSNDCISFIPVIVSSKVRGDKGVWIPPLIYHAFLGLTTTFFRLNPFYRNIRTLSSAHAVLVYPADKSLRFASRPTWRYLFDAAFQLAEVSRKIPIAAVRLDLELLHDGPYTTYPST